MERLKLNHCIEDNKHCICRVCLKYNTEGIEDKVISVFDNYNHTVICDKINSIVNIDIRKGDGLPDKICFLCLQSLETAYEFKQKCEHSDNILRSAIQAGAPLHENLEEPVKQEPRDSEYDEELVHSGELQIDDIKHEYEYTELSDGATQEGEELQSHTQPSEQLTPKTKQTFKSKAINLHLECHDCGQFFRTKCKLRVHWKKEHLPSQLTCPNCKKVCNNYKSFHAHIKKKLKSCILCTKLNVEGVGRSRIFYCTECEYKTKKISLIKVHFRVHSGDRPFSCKICNKSFTQHVSLKNHNEVVHNINVKVETCKYCGKYYKGSVRLYKHVKTHTARFPCELCGRVLKSKTALEGHIQRHSGIKIFTCEICAKMFISLSELINHKAIVHAKSRLYKCDKCEFSRSSHKSITNHKRRHTDNNIPCLICGNFVDNLEQLKLHQKKHEKRYKCEHCDKGFKKLKYLQTHVRKQHSIVKANTIKKEEIKCKINATNIPSLFPVGVGRGVTQDSVS